MTLRGRKSRRETLLANKAHLEGLAALTGKPTPKWVTRIPGVRGPRKPSGSLLERDVAADVRDAVADMPDVTLWRNNRGQVLLPNGGRITYGVGPAGASDFIGYRSLVVTPDMVGQRLAVFCAVETKAPGKALTPAQEQFIERVRAAGGRAGVAHSADDAARVLSD